MARDLEVRGESRRLDDAAVALLASTATPDRPRAAPMWHAGPRGGRARESARRRDAPVHPAAPSALRSGPGSRGGTPGGAGDDERQPERRADLLRRRRCAAPASGASPTHSSCTTARSTCRATTRSCVRSRARRSPSAARAVMPRALPLMHVAPPLLAVGGDLKNAFCLASHRIAWMSQHLGDLGNVETLVAFGDPSSSSGRCIASSQSCSSPTCTPATSRVGGPSERPPSRCWVQHHHAHVGGVDGRAPHRTERGTHRFAFDGTGYGTDGTVWGGEVLVARYDGFERAAHLRTIAIPGGDAGVRSPARIALAHLRAAGEPWSTDLAPVLALPSGGAWRARSAVGSTRGLRTDIERRTVVRCRELSPRDPAGLVLRGAGRDGARGRRHRCRRRRALPHLRDPTAE